MTSSCELSRLMAEYEEKKGPVETQDIVVRSHDFLLDLQKKTSANVARAVKAVKEQTSEKNNVTSINRLEILKKLYAKAGDSPVYPSCLASALFLSKPTAKKFAVAAGYKVADARVRAGRKISPESERALEFLKTPEALDMTLPEAARMLGMRVESFRHLVVKAGVTMKKHERSKASVIKTYIEAHGKENLSIKGIAKALGLGLDTVKINASALGYGFPHTSAPAGKTKRSTILELIKDPKNKNKTAAGIAVIAGAHRTYVLRVAQSIGLTLLSEDQAKEVQS